MRHEYGRSLLLLLILLLLLLVILHSWMKWLTMHRLVHGMHHR